jgi:hypothetical protein
VLGKVSMHGSVQDADLRAAGDRAARRAVDADAVGGGLGLGGRRPARPARHAAHASESEVNDAAGLNAVNQWEERTVAAIPRTARRSPSNCALRYDHLGARDLNNVLEFCPHVGNLRATSSSAPRAPTGTRGHMLATHMADADIRYALFKDLGRTTTCR